MTTTPPEFSFSTIENFDEHISSSIPRYEDLISSILNLSPYFIEDDTNVYDLGCSTGKLLNNLKEKNISKSASYYGLEIEDNFIDKKIESKDVNIFKQNINTYNGHNNASMITSIFTLQFIPLKDRQDMIDKIYNSLNKGGAFIFSEKVLSKHLKLQEIMTFQYYDFKRKTFTPEEILTKENNLRNIMKPITLQDNLSMLKSAGFSEFDIFWRNNNFLSILAIKWTY